MKNYQKRVKEWDIETFGQRSDQADVVSVRVFEEAVELCQTHSISKNALYKVIEQVYNKPVGDSQQEVAGILVSLFNYSNHVNIDAETSFLKEIERCEQNSELIVTKNKSKLHKNDLYGRGEDWYKEQYERNR